MVPVRVWVGSVYAPTLTLWEISDMYSWYTTNLFLRIQLILYLPSRRIASLQCQIKSWKMVGGFKEGSWYTTFSDVFRSLVAKIHTFLWHSLWGFENPVFQFLEQEGFGSGTFSESKEAKSRGKSLDELNLCYIFYILNLIWIMSWWTPPWWNVAVVRKTRVLFN